MTGRIIILITLISCWHSVGAQVNLVQETSMAPVPELEYFRSGDLSASVAEMATQDFQTLGARPGSLGFDSKAAHWFRFTVNNNSDITHWLAEVAYAPLDQIDFYYRDAEDKWVHLQGGDRFPLSQRKYRNRHMVFDLDIPAHSTDTVYLKVVTESSIQVPINIWTPEKLNQNNYDSQFSHGIFYGIMLIMVFYNLFLYLSIRDRTTLYYIFTLIFGSNVIAFFQGYGFLYLYPEHPEWGGFFSALSSPLFIVSSVALTRSFLSLERFSFDLDRILIALAIVSVLAGACILTFDGYFTYSSLHFLSLLDFILILVSAMYCFRRNYRPARYFLLAWVSLLLVGALFSLRNLGYVQSNWFTNNALYFGGVMQTLLISFALGDRINVLKRENEEARQRELDRELKAKELLETEVQQRTEQLQLQKNQLVLSNSIKDKLFSIISHDLKGPLNSLKGTLTVWQLGALKADELEVLTQQIGGQLQQTSEFLDNLLQWAKSQLQGEVVRPERIEMSELLHSSVGLILPEFNKKNIALDIEASSECVAYADTNMIRTVVRNLVSNSLKFTQPGGKVTLRAQLERNQVQVTVADNGVGIAPQSLVNIFTLQGVTTSGTREEKGTGIGLVLCKEFVERNGGHIYVSSAEGKGSVFGFTLPAADVAKENVKVLV